MLGSAGPATIKLQRFCCCIFGIEGHRAPHATRAMDEVTSKPGFKCSMHCRRHIRPTAQVVMVPRGHPWKKCRHIKNHNPGHKYRRRRCQLARQSVRSLFQIARGVVVSALVAGRLTGNRGRHSILHSLCVALQNGGAWDGLFFLTRNELSNAHGFSQFAVCRA